MSSKKGFTKSLLLIITFIIGMSNIFAMDIKIQGFVRDATSKEPLIGASIIVESSEVGTITNSYGYFSLTIPQKYIANRIIISFVGYKSFFGNITSSELQSILLEKGVEIEEVSVVYRKNIEETNSMSKIDIPLKEMNLLPHLVQKDIIKSIQLLPGIQGGNEGSAGLYVRGGGIDQNLVLLDDMPIYFINHAGNLVSVFDNNTIKDFKLYKGAFPARYGGRLSSVLDIKMKEGNKAEYHGEVGIGLISGNAFIEGPIIKDKASFFLSYRRFWPEVVLTPISKTLFNNTKLSYGFDDLSAKISADLSPRDKIFLSFYKGKDDLTFNYMPAQEGDDTGYATTSWNNMAGSLKYTHAFSNSFFSDFTLYYTKYQYRNEFEYKSYRLGIEEPEIYFAEYLSNVKDVSAKLDFEYMPISKLSLRFGGQLISHEYIPGLSRYNSTYGELTSDTLNFENVHSLEPELYLETNYSINRNISFNVGLRNSFYSIADTNFIFLQPRLMARFTFPGIMTMKISYAKMQQSIHLLTYSGVGFPSDLWLPATKTVPPATSHQFVIGFYKSVYEDMLEIGVEGYYKYMHDLIAYKEGVSFFAGTEDWQEKLERNGNGSSKGLELLLRKKQGKLNGWISYTLARTDRYFENKNNATPFPFKYDRRNSISIAGNYEIRKNLVLSMNWVYGSGYPITLGRSKYFAPDVPTRYDDLPEDIFNNQALIENYTGVNTYRMRNTHRLDLALNLKKQKKHTERIWSFSIYNAYNRQNPYYYYYQYNRQSKEYNLYQQSLFPILLSISYSVQF